MNTLEWFGAKTVCKHKRVEAGIPNTLFEERVVLLKAADFDDAIAKGEVEAQEYCRSITNTQVTYTGYINVYRLFDEKVGHRTEVFSLMRESELSDSAYLDHFYDDGRERTQTTE